MKLKLPWMKPGPRRRRQTASLKKRLQGLLRDADTYVYGGLMLVALAIGLLVGLAFDAGFGLGAGLLTFGTGVLGLGIWLLPPRTKGAE